MLLDNGPTLFSVPGAKLGSESDTDFYAEYELLGEIGRGGMGVIYKAFQPELNRTVALKVIHSVSHGGAAARKRFEAEVKVAARLSHPNIVPVFDVGVMDGCPSFSMEFFSGGTLAQLLARQVVPIDEGVALLIKVARAVFFAHQRGVLHRDLKPANILLDAQGEPHVADFGLAKELDSQGELTRPGAVLGSPNYMSPEQAAGKSESLTVATDIYSLGAMLYELLTRRPPFQAATPLETMRLVVEQDPPRPGALVARIDRDLETICLKCLDKDPTRRYATADDLAADLERWLRHEPILARTSTAVERLLKWARRRPALAASIVMLHFVFAAGIAGVLWQWRQAEFARRNEAQQLRRAEVALARSSIALAESAIRDGNGPEARAALASVPAEWRDGTWNYLIGESDTSRSLASIGLGEVEDLAADPSRPSVFAATERSGKVVIFNVRDGSRLMEIAPGFERASSNASSRLAIRSDGHRIAIGRSGPGGVVIHAMESGRKLVEWPTFPVGRIEFSPDGASLLLTSRDRWELELRDAENGEILWNRREGYHAARFIADGRQVASYCWSDNLRLLQSIDGEPVLKLSGEYYYEAASQPNGNLLAAVNPLGFVRGFDLSDGRVRFEFHPHQSLISRVVFLPGGERFLTAATLPDGRQALQCWQSSNGRASQLLTGGSGEIRALAMHPLSGELVVCGTEHRFWEVATLQPMRIIRSRNAHPSAVFWGDDDTLFAPRDDGTASAHLWSLSDDGSRKLWHSPDPGLGQPSVSANGRRAAMGRYNSGTRIVVLERAGEAVRQIASLNPRCVVAHVRISPKGDRVAVIDSDFARLHLLDVATDKPAVQLEAPDMNRFGDVVWLDDGAHLAGLVTTRAPRSTPGSVEQIVLWETATGRLVRSVTNASVTSVACAAPDGRRFVEAGADRNVRLRDAATLKILREFRVHNAPITALAWHPTRPILATASEDLVIRIWNLDTGARLEELRGPESPPSVLSFSPGGTRLATAARDQVVRIWEPRSLR